MKGTKETNLKVSPQKGLLPCLHPELIEAGCDEAGRGCLAGDVYAAAVILPPDYSHPLLNDSKQLTEKQRYALREDIERDALAWALGIVTAKEIDEINILNASILAMHRALDGLKIRPEYVVVDGNKFKPYGDTPHETVVKGDGKLMNIAAASILAKTYRNRNYRLIMYKRVSCIFKISFTLVIDFGHYGFHFISKVCTPFLFTF